MNPLRLIILAGLIYFAWLLLRRRIQDYFRNELLRQQEKEQASKDAAAQDVLEEDPVCRVLIPRRQAIRLRQGGKTYYFCSDACCDKFIGGTEGVKNEIFH